MPYQRPIEIPPVIPPGPQYLPDRLASKIENVVNRLGVLIFNAIFEPTIDLVQQATDYVAREIYKEIKPLADPFLDDLLENPHVPENIKRAIRGFRTTPPIPAAAIFGSLIMALIVAAAMASFGAISQRITHFANRVMRPARLPVADAIRGFWQAGLPWSLVQEHMADQGWSDGIIEKLPDILKPLLPEGMILQLMLREKISDARTTGELGKRGYDTEEIAWLKELAHLIPTVADLVRMAVREAWSPEAIREFKLHDEFPSEFATWLERQGMSREWAMNYWAAHWELPGVMQIYEMLHRRVITDAQFDLLLKMHDVVPTMRPWLKAISYAPYTRVDIRRMYQAGVLDQEQVYWSYRDIGYNHERATNLTKFTVLDARQAEKDLTKADILWGFREGVFTEAEAIGHIQGLGYSREEARFYIVREKHVLREEEINETIDLAKLRYMNGIIDEQSAIARLAALNLSARRITRTMNRWEIERLKKIVRPSVETLAKLYVARIIKKERFEEELKLHGFSDVYIRWYVELYERERGD